MKVSTVEISVLRVPVARAYQAAGRTVSAHWHVLAELVTTDGVRGYGYVVMVEETLMRAIASAARELAPRIVGIDVFDTEAAWSRMARWGDWIGPGGLLHFAISPIDIAMWDAAARTAALPLAKLLGGFRDRVPAYASNGFWTSLTADELAARAQACVGEGFKAIKLRVGAQRRLEDEASRVATVRAAVGDDVAILVDATESWSVEQAIRAGHMLAEAGASWLEDPTSHTNISGLATVTRSLPISVATGERLYTNADFRRLFEAGGTRIGLIDLGRVGGITPWRRIAGLAQAFEIPVCGHVLPEVHLHLLASVPNAHLVEHVPRSESILQGMPAMEGGELVLPSGPGLGPTVNMDRVRDYTVDG